MEFGSKEWFEAVNERVTFPNYFAYYYSKSDNTITSQLINSKAKTPDGIKYSSLKSYWGHALIEVVEVKSDKEYFQICEKLMKEWCGTIERSD